MEISKDHKFLKLYLLEWDGGQEYVAANSVLAAMSIYPNLAYTSAKEIGTRVLVIRDNIQEGGRRP